MIRWPGRVAFLVLSVLAIFGLGALHATGVGD